jgi:hypothetical protein
MTDTIARFSIVGYRFEFGFCFVSDWAVMLC